MRISSVNFVAEIPERESSCDCITVLYILRFIYYDKVKTVDLSYFRSFGNRRGIFGKNANKPGKFGTYYNHSKRYSYCFFF